MSFTITFINLIFNTDTADAVEIASLLRDIPGLKFVQGEHDMMFRWSQVSEFEEKIHGIHRALTGTGTMYRVYTVEEEADSTVLAGWAPLLGSEPREHPGYAQRRTGSPPAVADRAVER